MKPFKKVWEVVSFIPKGKILTYKKAALIAKVTPRTVGFALNKNRDTKSVPCHRVIASNGDLLGYAFGGQERKKELLLKEGVHIKSKTDIEKYLYKPDTLLLLYFELLFNFGYPGKWPWHKINKTTGNLHAPEEIIIGAILTQNTNWRNVDKAINNLKKAKANTINAVYLLGKNDLDKLKQLIKPSGFYNQKAERLYSFCKYIIKNYGDLNNFFQSNVPNKLRAELLNLKGIGEETADTILLYAGGKPTFVIDAYTKRFCKSKNLTQETNYALLQKFFTENLPENVSLYQNYHALIVKWGKMYKSTPKNFNTLKY